MERARVIDGRDVAMGIKKLHRNPRMCVADFIFFFLPAMRTTLTRQKGLRSMDSNVPAASTQMSATKTMVRDGPKREAESVSGHLASRPLSR